MVEILLTNDDGIGSEGLYALWKAVKGRGRVAIAAPAEERSTTSTALSIGRAIRMEPKEWEEETTAWAVHGMPADCVKLGLFRLQQHPKLVLAGINRGPNMGRATLYSGTIGCCVEAAVHGIPAIAFSSIDETNPDFSRWSQYIPKILDAILATPPPPGTIMNVNFPATQSSPKGCKLARQGLQHVKEAPSLCEEKEHYLLGGCWARYEEHPESDVSLLEKGYITVTPINVREQTHQEYYARSEKTYF